MAIIRFGDHLIFDAVFTTAGVGTPGLPVLVYVYGPSGILLEPGTLATEIGLGLYTYTFPGARVLDAGEGHYRCVFRTPITTVDRQDQYALWVAKADYYYQDPLLAAVPGPYAAGSAGYALGLLYGNGTVTVIGPLTADGTLHLYVGDSYNPATQPIRFIDGSAGWPDLAGATATLYIGPAFSAAGTLVVPSGLNKEVRVDLAAADTSQLKAGVHRYTLRATWPAPRADVLVLVQGQAAVLPVP